MAFDNLYTLLEESKNPQRSFLEDYTNKNVKYDIKPTGFGGSKDLRNKRTMRLVPLDILEILNIPLQNGLRKGYKENDWMDGIDTMTAYEASLRHLQDYMKGIDIDPDGDIPHIYAAAFNLCIIALNHYYGRKDLDNRWLPSKLNKDKNETPATE